MDFAKTMSTIMFCKTSCFVSALEQNDKNTVVIFELSSIWHAESVDQFLMVMMNKVLNFYCHFYARCENKSPKVMW